MKYLIGNWKANKNIGETHEYIEKFTALYKESDDRTVIVCPSYHLLSSVSRISGLPRVSVGSQDVSTKPFGSFTGEIAAPSLKGMVEYVIIGHSERRKHFGETDDILAAKTKQALDTGLTPIYCIRDEKDAIPERVRFVAYEPVAAIGTGQNEAPEKVLAMKQRLTLPANAVFIYGGSVNAANAGSYLNTGEIDGFLVGKASLDPASFLAIIP